MYFVHPTVSAEQTVASYYIVFFFLHLQRLCTMLPLTDMSGTNYKARIFSSNFMYSSFNVSSCF